MSALRCRRSATRASSRARYRTSSHRLIGITAAVSSASRQSSHSSITTQPTRKSTLPTQANAASAATR